MKYQFKDSDFRIEWFSGQGAGGQHRNKHMNCCRVIHEATGIKATGQRSRSREDNKATAMSVCKARVIAAFTEKPERYNAPDKLIRTYHEPDNRVYNHESGEIGSYKKIVVDKNLEFMIESLRKFKMEE